ncbi:MAG: hypothetical protein U5K33_00485 [Halofilum sp. (in: g-proteobacteria)]|nr:hypothetical protein [Halofilum sp. (in: g-proteobacteria)]
MSFLRSGYPVGFRPINVGKREGTSHIRIFNDGAPFIYHHIQDIATLYSPLKLFSARQRRICTPECSSDHLYMYAPPAKVDSRTSAH